MASQSRQSVPLSLSGIQRLPRGAVERKRESLTPGIYRWLRTNGCNRKRAEAKDNITHLIKNPFLSKFGCGTVRNDQLEDFYQAYAESIENGDRVYMIEQATHKSVDTFYRMHCDLDMLFEEGVVFVDDMWSGIMKSFQQVMRDSFESKVDTSVLVGFTDASEETVSSSKLRPGLDLKEEKINVSKIGAHLYWPDVFVSNKTALALRVRFLKLIKSNISYEIKDDTGRQTYKLLNDWESIIDINVTRNANLRMFGSRKCTKCPCPANACDHPDRVIDQGRLYRPDYVFYINPDGNCNIETTNALRGNFTELLRTASLRIHSNTASPHTIDADEVKASSTNRRSKVSDVIAKDQHDLIVELLQQMCGSDIPKMDCIQYNIVRGQLRSVIVPVTSRFCCNLGRAHHNNGVYITVRTRVLISSYACETCWISCSCAFWFLNWMSFSFYHDPFSSSYLPVPGSTFPQLFCQS